MLDETRRCIPVEAGGAEIVCSHNPAEANTQGLIQGVSSATKPPLGTGHSTSLTSSDGFSSTCGEWSVDLSSERRDNQIVYCASTSKDDFGDGPNHYLNKSSSVMSDISVEMSDVQFNNSLGLGKDVSPEFKGNPEDCAGGDPDQETGVPYKLDDPTEDDIRIPLSDKNEDSLATYADGDGNKNDDDDDDQDEECYDGVEWSKPSSLSRFEEDTNKSCPFKEEREKVMEGVMNGKFKNLVSQLLKTVGIVNLEREVESWVDIVSSLAWAAALFVKPDDAAEGKAMDPAGYVKVKCVATGTRNESKLIKGLVFKKHAAHKHMATQCTKPKLLLIQGMLGHSSGLLSIKSMIQDKDIVQKKENMADDVRTLLEHVEACHPNVVLMEKTAPRDVLETILKMGVKLVVDMKLHRLERIARCTGSPIWSAGNMQDQKLKRCDLLYFEKTVEEHGDGGKKPHKTLMFLEGSPNHLDCTILLKGSQIEELKKIKCVVQCAVVMGYHFIMETSFLIDQEVMFSTISSDGGACQRGKVSSDTNSSVSYNKVDISSSSGRINPILLNDFHGEHAVKYAIFSTDMIDIPISGSVPPEFIQVDEGGHDNLSSQSEYNAAVQDVMGTLVSSAEQYLKPFLHLDDRYSDTQAANSVSVIRTDEAPWHCGTEPNGCSNDEKLIDNDNNFEPFLSTKESATDLPRNGSDSDDYTGRKDDISTVLDSQSILVLMSSRNALRGTICEQSHFSHIKFYRNLDVPLGKFLRDNVLNQTVPCKACGEQPEAHYYYYAHHNKQLTIRVKRIPGEPLPGDDAGKLWMWSRCGKCKPEKDRKRNTSKLVLISNAARGLSFGKFLELSFSNYSSCNRLSNCGHSLHKDFLYFFGFGSMASMFRYSPVAKYTVSVPTRKLEFNSPIKGDRLQKETENVYSRTLLFFSEVSGYLKKIETRFSCFTLNINGSSKEFISIEKMLAAEKFKFEENYKNICIKNGHSVRKLLCLNRLRWELFLEACIWNQRLHLLLSSGFGSAYSSKPNLAQYGNNKSEATPPSKVGSVGNGRKDLVTCTDVEVQIEAVPGPKELDIARPIMDSVILPSSQDLKDPREPVLKLLSSNGSSHTENTVTFDQLLTKRKIPALEELRGVSLNSGKSLSNKVATQPVSNVEISIGQWVWNPFSVIREQCMKDLYSRVHSPSFLDLFRLDTLHLPDCLPIVSRIIEEEGSRVHIPLFSDDYFVSDYEGEISSIIACAVAFMNDVPHLAVKTNKDENDAQYDKGTPTRTDKFVSLPRAISVPYPLWSSSSTSSGVDMLHTAPSMSFLESRFSSFDGSSLMESLGRLHPEVHLGMEVHPGKAKYAVLCLYANEFRGLRNLCCPSELDYISSLSRCKFWDAKGGKSKSFFSKTLDDRLIIKEIKRTEFDSFLKFACDYFKYMKQSFESGNQTCLVRILGLYQVIVRQPKSGKEVKHDLMVMENLTFGRNISRQYDLKGALHARYTATEDGSGDVLLDQNFVNDMNLSPLYVGQKAKRLIQRAVWNDTTFLNSINVMDYSLLVGVDLEHKELVCGIIDYLRQYTWDKQLETWVKSSLVVPKNVLPTIISPKEYKKRFRKFMDTHFLAVPDSWCSRRSSNPCRLCGIEGENPSCQPKSEKQEELNNVSHAS